MSDYTNNYYDPPRGDYRTLREAWERIDLLTSLLTRQQERIILLEEAVRELEGSHNEES